MKKSVLSGVMLVLFFGPFGLIYGNIGMGLLFVPTISTATAMTRVVFMWTGITQHGPSLGPA